MGKTVFAASGAHEVADAKTGALDLRILDPMDGGAEQTVSRFATSCTWKHRLRSGVEAWDGFVPMKLMR